MLSWFGVGITLSTYQDETKARVFTLTSPLALIALHHLTNAGTEGITPTALSKKLGHKRDGSSVNLLKVLIRAGTVERAPKIGKLQPYRVLPGGLENLAFFACDRYFGISRDKLVLVDAGLAEFSPKKTEHALRDYLLDSLRAFNPDEVRPFNYSAVLAICRAFLNVSFFVIRSQEDTIKHLRSDTFRELIKKNPRLLLPTSEEKKELGLK